tara:strand:+ start:165 stop:743 length:579 start_codon:yes stop_codon:yes gene_type:complete
MKLLLVVATREEIEIKRFDNFDVLITGVGMVNSTMHLTQHLCFNDYDLVINMGIAGAFSDVFEIGEVVEVVEDIFSEIGFETKNGFHQFTDFKLDVRFKSVPKTNLLKARSLTVNTVHGEKKSIKAVRDLYNPDVETMEGAAIFKVCEQFGVQCIQVRSISNIVEERNLESWNVPLATENLNIEVEKIIRNL